jgi:hypothetical protein
LAEAVRPAQINSTTATAPNAAAVTAVTHPKGTHPTHPPPRARLPDCFEIQTKAMSRRKCNRHTGLGCAKVTGEHLKALRGHLKAIREHLKAIADGVQLSSRRD